MSINNTVCLFLISLLTKSGYCKVSDDYVPVRFERGDLHEFMEERSDPNFWPVRGRRDDLSGEYLAGYDVYGEKEPYPLRRGGRKSKEEETGVFWAGRGRSFDLRDLLTAAEEEPNFWAHRGRSSSGYLFGGGALSAEEPGWIWVSRPPKSDGNENDIPCSTGATKRQKPCNLKRKSNTLLRELPQADQFWPVRGKRSSTRTRLSEALREVTQMRDAPWTPSRGKRPEDSLKEELRELKSFWPARGRRNGQSDRRATQLNCAQQIRKGCIIGNKQI